MTRGPLGTRRKVLELLALLIVLLLVAAPAVAVAAAFDPPLEASADAGGGSIVVEVPGLAGSGSACFDLSLAVGGSVASQCTDETGSLEFAGLSAGVYLVTSVSPGVEVSLAGAGSVNCTAAGTAGVALVVVDASGV